MRATVLFTAALLLTGPAAAAQQIETDPAQPVVVVTGRGTAERMPDFGDIQVFAMGEGDSQVEALAALESRRARLVDGLQRLDGAEVDLLRSDDVRIDRVMGPDCEADNYNPQRSQGVCEPQGYVASMNLHLRVLPADRVGQALSLAAELGSTQVRASGFGLTNPRELRNEAARAAFADARRQAEFMAEAGGGRLGRIIRIQDGASRPADSLSGLVDVEEIVITGSRIRPAVQLAVTPEPVEASATLGVIFELLP